jgi:hypothetical protein
MSAIHRLIESLRLRSDLGIIDEKDSWLINISKGKDFACEVTIPRDVLEWHASVKHRQENKEVWSDWMDYSGYNDDTKEKLEADMARDIAAFVNRVSINELRLPLQIFEKNA